MPTWTLPLQISCDIKSKQRYPSGWMACSVSLLLHISAIPETHTYTEKMNMWLIVVSLRFQITIKPHLSAVDIYYVIKAARGIFT